MSDKKLDKLEVSKGVLEEKDVKEVKHAKGKKKHEKEEEVEALHPSETTLIEKIKEAQPKP